MTPGTSHNGRLPPELLDFIFEFAVETERAETPVNQPIRNARDFALVCRSWRIPAHRIVFEQGYIYRNKVWESCLNMVSANRELAPFIRSMTIRTQAGERRRTVQDLSNLLQLFPRLNTVKLRLSEGSSFGYQADYSPLATLPNLRHLSLSSHKFDTNLSSYRQILQRTPNITSLSLVNCGSEERIGDEPVVPSPESEVIPIHLPFLSKLSLQGNQYIRVFEKLHLLSDQTLGNVVELHLSTGIRDRHSHGRYNATPLLQQIGKQLATLEVTYWGGGIGGLTFDEVLELCPNVTTLKGTVHRDLAALPSCIQTLDLNFINPSLGVKQVGKFLEEKSKYLTNVETLEIHSRHGEHGKLVALAKPFCAQVKGLRLVVDGCTIDLSDVVIESEEVSNEASLEE